MDEIEDRRQFLEEMMALGKGHQYQQLINTEISQVKINSQYCHTISSIVTALTVLAEKPKKLEMYSSFMLQQ